MNKISQLRRSVQQSGVVLLDLDGYNQLQGEWIKRVPFENSIPISKIEELIYRLRNKTLGEITPDTVQSKILDTESLVVDLQKLIDELNQRID